MGVVRIALGNINVRIAFQKLPLAYYQGYLEKKKEKYIFP